MEVNFFNLPPTRLSVVMLGNTTFFNVCFICGKKRLVKFFIGANDGVKYTLICCENIVI